MWARVLEEFHSGTTDSADHSSQQEHFLRCSGGIDAKKRSGSPAAPNRWKMRILVADSARQLTVPLSKFNTGRGGALEAAVQTEDWFGNECLCPIR